MYSAPGGKRALCPGVLAGLIQMQEWIEENQDRGDATSYYARQMLDTFLKKVNREKSTLTGGTRTIRLEPALQESEGQLSLTWRIGTEKMYVVKNLTELAGAVQEKISFNLGKNSTLHFDRDRFDDRSEKYYTMIQDAVRETREINLRQRQSWYSPALPEIKGSLPLFGARLDLFYDTSSDTVLQMIRNTGGIRHTFPLRFTEENPEPKLTLNQIVRRASLPRHKVIALLARLIRFHIVNWEYADQQFYFFIP